MNGKRHLLALTVVFLAFAEQPDAQVVVAHHLVDEGMRQRLRALALVLDHEAA